MDLRGVEKRKEKKVPREAETERYQKPGFRYSDGSVHSACEPCRLVRDLQFSGNGLSYGRRAVDRPDVHTPRRGFRLEFDSIRIKQKATLTDD